MTLREGLQELTEQLREQGKMVVLLDAILAQTADDDAERVRLAEIGQLVGELLQNGPQVDEHVSLLIEADAELRSRIMFCDEFGEFGPQPTTGPLLDALRKLAEKVGVK